MYPDCTLMYVLYTRKVGEPRFDYVGIFVDPAAIEAFLDGDTGNMESFYVCLNDPKVVTALNKVELGV